MKTRPLLVLAAAAALAAPAFAQSEPQCIVAGRLSGGQWAPKHATIHLLGADGKAIAASGRAALAQVRRARLDQPALLSKCDGDNPLFVADDEAPGTKTEVPGLARGTVEVEGVGFPKLRTGGELVELRVRVPADRVVMMTR